MLNCYVLDPEDSVDSIGKIISDMYKISCGGGGIGFNFSRLFFDSVIIILLDIIFLSMLCFRCI